VAEVITSSELRVGDVFFDPRRTGPVHAGDWHPAHGLRRVAKIRDLLVGSGAYKVIDYNKLDDPATGQLDLRVDVAMCRVWPISSDRAHMLIANLVDGERVTVWHAEGKLWA
jgi:hypothetical protein